MKKGSTSEILVNELVTRIVTNYSPQKIILFGSYAYGEPGEDSDLDILIIKETNERFIERYTTIRRILTDSKRKVPLDPIVLTPDEIARRVAKGDQFILEIIERGKVLYAA